MDPESGYQSVTGRLWPGRLWPGHIPIIYPSQSQFLSKQTIRIEHLLYLYSPVIYLENMLRKRIKSLKKIKYMRLIHWCAHLFLSYKQYKHIQTIRYANGTQSSFLGAKFMSEFITLINLGWIRIHIISAWFRQT